MQVHRSVDYYIEKQAMLSSHAYKIEKVNRVKKFMGKYYWTSKLMDVTTGHHMQPVWVEDSFGI